jgi:hypothetical protein
MPSSSYIGNLPGPLGPPGPAARWSSLWSSMSPKRGCGKTKIKQNVIKLVQVVQAEKQCISYSGFATAWSRIDPWTAAADRGRSFDVVSKLVTPGADLATGGRVT